jgi:hypothetical protein
VTTVDYQADTGGGVSNGPARATVAGEGGRGRPGPRERVAAGCRMLLDGAPDAEVVGDATEAASRRPPALQTLSLQTLSRYTRRVSLPIIAYTCQRQSASMMS